MITLDSIDVQTISTEKLGELLISAKKAYYTTGKPIMDDHTYDTLEDILRQKSPHHRIFTKAGHPNFDTGFDKKQHVMVMGSQNKVTSFKDLVHYFELKKVFAPLFQGGVPSDPEGRGGFVVQPKCDGISVEIEYQNGHLVDAVTRGDGRIGDVITQNIVKMKQFVLNPSHFSGSVRCEIMVTKTDFEKLNDLVKNNESGEIYSNPRNAASGLSQRLDGKYSEYCTLFAVDIFPSPPTEIDKTELLKSLGFTPVETILCQSFDQIESVYQEYLVRKRLSYPFEIDGLVIKINNGEIQRLLGSKNNRPQGQVAYKFPSQSNQTTIRSITWQVGPLGTVTPVAKVEPVELAGAIITYASLANYDLIVKKGINIGDIVQISRRGDVIPHIEKVVSKVTPGHLPAPKICPACQTPLVIEDKYLRCPNYLGCLPQITGSLALFCNTLDIKGLSSKTIDKLYQAGRIKHPGDFFKLTVEDIRDLDNLGDKSAGNIIHQIQSKKVLSLTQVFDAAIIPNFSAQRISQLISAGFDTPQKILNLTQAQLSSLPGFQTTLATKVWQGIQSRRDWINSILSQVTLQDRQVVNQKLSGLNFCITGSLSQPRKTIVDQIEKRGGKIQTSVSANTNYLICNQASDSDKYQSALKLGIKIIAEDDLLQLL